MQIALGIRALLQKRWCISATLHFSAANALIPWKVNETKSDYDHVIQHFC
jgi:hypothetical protein